MYTPGKHNVVADALSQISRISAMKVAHHEEFADMKNNYNADSDFAEVWKKLQQGESHPDYTTKDGYLLMNNRLCIINSLKEKVLKECHQPPYAGHRGKAATLSALERFFYWPTLRKDTHRFVESCLVCQKSKYN